MAGETFAAEIGLAQLVALDHRAHRSVQDQDALAEQPGEVAAAGEALGRIRQAGIRHVQVRREGWATKAAAQMSLKSDKGRKINP